MESGRYQDAEDRREGRGWKNLFGHLIFFVRAVTEFSISVWSLPSLQLSENINQRTLIISTGSEKEEPNQNLF